jgi:hypothetical protein
MSAVCYRCQRFLPTVVTWQFGMPEPDDAWHMTNPAPNAAANPGPTVMLPICNKCEPLNVPISGGIATTFTQIR